MDALVVNNDPADLDRIEAIMKAADDQAKEQVRRAMGLP
jgi:hypothetical protein